MGAKFSNPFWRQERDAVKLLRGLKIEPQQIVRTDNEAILFVRDQKPWVAWTDGEWSEDEDKRRIRRVDRGFPAFYE